MPVPVPIINLGHFYSVISAQEPQSIVKRLVQNGAVLGAPHLSLSCGLGFRHVWVVNEALPETEHVLRERVKPSELESKTEIKS